MEFFSVTRLGDAFCEIYSKLSFLHEERIKRVDGEGTTVYVMTDDVP